MNGDADVLGAAFLASKLGRQIPVHCAMIRPELVAELQEIQIGMMGACWPMAPDADALAIVYAVLDGVTLHGEGAIWV